MLPASAILGLRVLSLHVPEYSDLIMLKMTYIARPCRFAAPLLDNGGLVLQV